MMKRLACLTILSVLISSPAFSQLVVIGDTTGADNFNTAGFYGVSVSGGSGFVESVSWDVSVDGDAFFDFDGGSNFLDATDAVLDFGSLVGIDATDINFVWSDPENHPTLLTAEFAPGSFSAGDSFRFGADTDNFVSDPAPGSVFGDAGAIFSVEFGNGEFASAEFRTVTATQSIATVASTIPEPTTTVLLLLLSIGLPAVRRR